MDVFPENVQGKKRAVPGARRLLLTGHYQGRDMKIQVAVGNNISLLTTMGVFLRMSSRGDRPVALAFLEKYRGRQYFCDSAAMTFSRSSGLSTLMVFPEVGTT